MKRISRLGLYELVSKSPLNRVAPSFGITASTLATICRQHNVPYPGSRYWTRKSLGQSVTLDPLPSMFDEQLIEIKPTKSRVRHAPGLTKDMVVGTATPAILTSLTPIIKQQLSKPHPIIAKWIADHERRSREARASRDPWRIRTAPAPFSEIDYRRHAILNALFQAVESRGAEINETEKGLLRVTINGEKIDFQIREKNRQVRLSPQDKRSSYLSQELVGTGKLVFAIRTYLRGPHDEEWRETDKKPLESQLPKIVERLFEGSRILKAWHAELEQERARWRQEEAQRAERDRLAKQEQKQREKLCELARDWFTANQIRDFLAMVKSESLRGEQEIHGKKLEDWITWAEATADALDTTRHGAEGLFSIIGNLKVEQGWR